MTIQEFREYMASGQPVVGGSDVHMMFHQLSQEALRITAEINSKYHTPEELHTLLEELWGREVPASVGLFPPFHTDCGKNTVVGERVFINMGCKFQDQGGITIDEGALIGHNVVLATINHDLDPAKRQSMSYRSQRDCACRSDYRRRRRGGCRCRRHKRCSSQYGGRRCPGQGYQSDRNLISMKLLLKILTIFVAVGAVGGAVMMWMDPSGMSWGGEPMLDLLRAKMPWPDVFFKNFIPSGFALLAVNGLPQILAALMLFKNHRLAYWTCFVCGTILMLWIALEWWIWGFVALSNIFFVLGVVEVVCACLNLRIGRKVIPF